MTTAVLFVLVAAVIGSNIATVRHEHDQALLVNIAARQRTLVERYTKDALLVSGGTQADPSASHEELRQTVDALLDGGEVTDLQGSADLHIDVEPIVDPRVREKLEQERRLIAELRVAGDAVIALEPADAAYPDAVLRLRVLTAQLSSVSNDVVGEMTRRTQSSLARVVLVQVVLGSLIALAAIVMTVLGRREGRKEVSARFRSLVEHSSDLLTVVDQQARVTYQSPSAERLAGRRAHDLIGTDYLELVHPDDRARVRLALSDLTPGPGRAGLLEYRIRHGDGSWLQMEAAVTDLTADPAVAGVVLNAHDVTDRKALEEQLAHQAFRDPLTGLANRALFADRVGRAAAGVRGGRSVPAVLLVDLDGFKTVNDSLGHGAGDELLVVVARRLETCVRAGDTVARLGGDEFAILSEEGSAETARGVAERILQILAQPCAVAGRHLFINASIGIALADEGKSADDLLRDADVAMYAAKGRGKGRYEVFEPHMHEAAVRRQELLGDLRVALDQGQFALVYQPVFDLRSQRMEGWEALLRWQHPIRGNVPPAEFIPLAEETGLIVPMGQWVLHQACRQASVWRQRYPAAAGLTMSVNIAARQLQESSLVDDVRAALVENELEPATLVLEITEGSVLAMDAAMEPLHALKALGVRLAIDDFGTGYSSLSYLSRFPIDAIKIDKSFVDGVADPSEQGLGLLRAIARLGPALGLQVVAEGAEEEGQLTQLLAAGCDAVQGFYFSRPLPPDDIETLLATDQALEATRKG